MNAFDAALAGLPCRLVSGTGRQPLPVLRWGALPDRADTTLLDRCTGPTVDVGCGPGRLAAALTARGVVTLGVDVSALAVRLTTGRGAVALRRDVFQRLPGEGRWRHVLLADGNIGIGGNPVDLLDRCVELLGVGGTVLVEACPTASGVRRCLATVEHGAGRSAPFQWAIVGADAVPALAAAAGLDVRARWHVPEQGRRAGRTFAELVRR